MNNSRVKIGAAEPVLEINRLLNGERTERLAVKRIGGGFNITGTVLCG